MLLRLDVTVVGVHSAGAGGVFPNGTTLYVRDSSGFTAIHFPAAVRELVAEVQPGSAYQIQGSFVLQKVVWKDGAFLASRLATSDWLGTGLPLMPRRLYEASGLLCHRKSRPWR